MPSSIPISRRPARLHHHAFVVRDQEATRRFYEDVVGLPLVATWCEQEDFGQGPMEYCHTFYQLEDGGCLAFFQFADAAFTAEQAGMASTSPFDHVALLVTEEVQAAILSRAEEAEMPAMVVDHGYCRSLYVPDPDGLVVELTVDDPQALREAPSRHTAARADLSRWLGGDRAPNNALRRDDGA